LALMGTYIVEMVVLKERGSVSIHRYYVTVADGEDPLVVFAQQNTAPHATRTRVVSILSASQTASFGFLRGDVRNVADV
jgi:hypothetical protein